MKKNPTPTEHVRRPLTSASCMFRRATCPGSALLEAKAFEVHGPQEDSDDSLRGQMLHRVMAGTEPEVNVTSERDKWAVKFAKRAEQELIEEIFPEGAKLKFEVERAYRWPDKPLDYAGQGDKVIRCYETRTVLLLDWKFGSNIIENAEVNKQGRVYAVCEGEERIKAGDKPWHIWFASVQPFAEEDWRVQKVCYAPEDFDAAKADIFAIRDNKSTDLCATIEGCRYCAARLDCAEHHRLVAELAGKFINFNELEPAKQAEYARGLKLLESIWNKSVKPALKEILTAKPDSVPGWALKPGGSMFDVEDPQLALDTLWTLLADDATEATMKFMAAVKVSVGALEEAAIDAMKKRGKVVTAVNEAGERTEQPPMAQAKLKEMIREMLLEAGAAKKSQKEPSLVEVRQ